MELTAHDGKLISAAIAHLLAIAGSGDVGAKAIVSVAKSGKKARNLLRSSIQVLASVAADSKGEDLAVPNEDVWDANIRRLFELSRKLLKADEPIAVEVSTVEPIANDGTPNGPKMYQLWLTHNEIHLLHWAMEFVEAGTQHDPLGMLEALNTYDGLPVDKTAFVDKFNQVHEAARRDDGENGTDSE